MVTRAEILVQLLTTIRTMFCHGWLVGKSFRQLTLLSTRYREYKASTDTCHPRDRLRPVLNIAGFRYLTRYHCYFRLLFVCPAISASYGHGSAFSDHRKFIDAIYILGNRS